LVTRLVTFGDPRLTDEAGRSIAFPEKAMIALAYMLSRSSPSISRVEIANFLWPESDNVKVLVNLRQLLARVKARQKELGLTLLVVSETNIEAAADAIEFDLNVLRAEEKAGPLAALAAYLRLVPREFLSGADPLTEKASLWIEAERGNILSRFAKAIDDAMAMAGAGDNGILIKDAAFRLLEIDPHNESAYRALMKAYAIDGHLSQAKALFARYKARLKEDLGLSPDVAMMELTAALFGAKDTRTGAVAAMPARLDPVEQEQPALGRRMRVSIPRLMILPPDSAGQPREQAVLITGLLEDVTIGLCRAKTVSVVAPYTAQRVAVGGAKRNEDFARFDITYVLETRLSQGMNGLSFFAALVDRNNDEIIWAERFNAAPEHLPRTYRETIQRIVQTTTDAIERKEFARIDLTGKPNAYQHYLIGQSHLKNIDLPDLRRARRSFKSALQDAPNFADALSGLSRAEHLEWLVTARGDDDLLRQSEAHALKAIMSDSDNAGGYHQIGVTKLYQGAYDESIEALSTAERIAPSHADIIADYADTLVHAAEPAAALEKIQRAIELNPLCQDVYWWTAAGANFFLGNFETALDSISQMEDESAASRLAAACWGMLGDKKKARAEVRITMEKYPDFEIEKWLAIVPLKEGWQKEHFREGLKKAGF